MGCLLFALIMGVVLVVSGGGAALISTDPATFAQMVASQALTVFLWATGILVVLGIACAAFMVWVKS